MLWKIRHQGSPRQLDGLTLAQVTEGLQDGLWEPTDEVMGPKDRGWTAIENHPQFAELLMDLEPSQVSKADDETRLDMTALIDVTLVLLIFFMLTMSYHMLERILDMPRTRSDAAAAIPTVRPEDQARMVKVEVTKQGGKTVILVEGKPVAEDDLVNTLKQQKKNELLLFVDEKPRDKDKVEWGTVVRVIAAAGQARIEKVHFGLRQKPPPG